jgi:hypothetical protein
MQVRTTRHKSARMTRRSVTAPTVMAARTSPGIGPPVVEVTVVEVTVVVEVMVAVAEMVEVVVGAWRVTSVVTPTTTVFVVVDVILLVAEVVSRSILKNACY